MKKKRAWDKNGTNLKYFVPCAEDAISVDVSIKTGATAVSENGTKNKHFVPRRKPDTPRHTAITTTIWDSFLGLKVKK